VVKEPVVKEPVVRIVERVVEKKEPVKEIVKKISQVDVNSIVGKKDESEEKE